LHSIFLGDLLLFMSIFTLRPVLASLTILGLLTTAGCKGGDDEATPANQIAFNDYESVEGWMPTPTSLTRERAHSGSHAVKVDGSVEFALGYNLPLGKALDHKPHKIHVEAWGFMTDPKSAARLGFQLYDPAQSKEIFGDGLDYTTAVQTPGKWVKISKDITLPTSTASNLEMKVFLWRAGASSPAYLDDLRISEVTQ
jgi:hypothetical protein